MSAGTSITPRLSVVIATHSRPGLLPRAVESARRAGTAVEIIVVDDGSTDETAAVCQRLPGIRYVRVERNQRVAGARNIGLACSTAEYVSFLDDDDIRYPDSYDVQIAALDRNPRAVLSYGKAELIDAAGHSLGRPADPLHPVAGDVFWQLLQFNFIYCFAAVFRRAAVLKVGLMDPTIPGIDDWDLFVRLAEFGDIIFVDRVVGGWRRADPDSDQGSVRIAQLYRAAARRHRDHWLRLPRARDASSEMRKRSTAALLNRMSDTLIWDSAQALDLGFARYARRGLIASLLLNPRRAIRPWAIQLLLKSFVTRGRSSA